MDKAKEAVGRAAVEVVKNGMKVGLGTGSTVLYFLKELGKKCREGLKIQAVASSDKSEEIARQEGIPLVEGGLIGPLDLVVDGADEVDSEKRLIKGGGGALLREKMLAYHAHQVVIIVDEGKISSTLGRHPLPIEIVTFGYKATMEKIEGFGLDPKLRMEGEIPYLTDNGNFILDIDVKESPISLNILDDILHKIPGVVETGFFDGLANTVIVGSADGRIRSF